MAYQVLARKWRPQDFSSLVGQAPIVTALRNAIREGRIAQAYLFSGIRGVGKTTTARLLAKALNCERGPMGDPCNQCVVCQEITRGSDLDVVEVDAATYSKVEQVRELTESLRYAPARDRYKVLIIDEIHRLSRQAFDALLKIVEEPPPHLVFIFATTESEAVPATILSRCQEFRFRRVTSQDLVVHLGEICRAEAISASETTLRLIARAGEGSVRDSVALLDQLATFGSGSIREEDAARLAGGIDTALFSRLLAAILAGDRGNVAEIARGVEDDGWDPRHVFPQFLAFCRDALHLAAGGSTARIDLPSEEAEQLAELSRRAGYENLLRLLTLLLVSEESIRRSEVGVLPLEIAWLRAAELPKLVRVEELLASSPGVSVAASRPSASVREPNPIPPPRTPGPSPAKMAAAVLREATAPPLDAPAAVSPTESSSVRDPIRAFREEVSSRRQPLAAHLEAAERLTYDGGELLIYLPPPPEGETARRALERPANRVILEESAARIWGPGTKWRIADAPRRTVVAPEPATPVVSREIAEHPTVQAVLEIFGGSLDTASTHPKAQEE